ncbi:MAG: LysM peptidoglycan-binding domain-containing protein [Armatimonadota bacterium]|jgi:LysM repeat protein
MRTDASDRKLRRSIRMMRAWRAIGLMGWLFFLCSLAYISFPGRPNQARAITVNGEPVLWVKDERAAESVLTTVLERKGGKQFDATVVHESVPLPEGGKILSQREAMAQLMEQLPVLVVGWKIVLEGEDIVAMDTREHAEKVLAELKARWGTLKDGEQIITQELKPVPVLRETTVPPGELDTDVQQAAEKLQSSDPERVTYVVQPGDNPSLVAHKFGVGLSALVAQNPTLKQVIEGDRWLRPGEKLTVRKQRRGVKVITVKQYEEERETELEPLVRRVPNLPRGEERLDREGTPRREAVTVTVTLENDTEVGRKEDRRLIAKGERPIKLVGTGR